MTKRNHFYIILSYILSVSSLFPVFISCSEDVKPNRVELEQLEIDGSTNDRHLFREELQKERERKKSQKKEEEF